jgi:hypothetical protein
MYDSRRHLTDGSYMIYMTHFTWTLKNVSNQNSKLSYETT